MFTVSGSELWAYMSRKFPQEICHQFSIMFHSELLVADLKREVSADEAVYDITYYMSSHMMPLGWHQENKMEIH